MTFKLTIARILQVFFVAAFLSASPAIAEKKKALTPMELQAIQSREFETSKESAFGATMTVIQDLGYTVESADIASGFITAASPTVNKTNFLEAFGGAASSGNTVMTVFILQMPSKMTRIRLNFVNSKSTSSAYGRGSRQDKPILDAAVYNNAWERVDEALFVMGALADTATPKPDATGIERVQALGGADSGVPADVNGPAVGSQESAKPTAPAVSESPQV